jgi:hypothetical protein
VIDQRGIASLRKSSEDQGYLFNFRKQLPNDVSRIVPHLLSQWTTEEEVDTYSLNFKLAIRVLRSNYNIHKLHLATPLRSKEPTVESIVNNQFISTQKPGALFNQQLDGLSILV